MVTSDSAGEEQSLRGRRQSDSTVRPSASGRRASDRIDVRGAARMLEILAARPTFDDIARELALGTLARLKPKFVVLGHLAPNAQLNVLGSFGLDDAHLTSLQTRSVWDGSFMSEAVRTGSLTLIGKRSDTSQGTWESDIDEKMFPIIAAPLLLRQSKVGALAIGVDESMTSIDFQEELSGVDFALALYLSMNFDTPPTNHEARAATTEPESSSIDALDEPPILTDRRREILTLMAEGMTNSQIARRIGFSESTVRHETMALYRLLGAQNREQASHIAHMHGLLDD